MNVPQLRFSGFDGEWEEVSLGKLGDFTKGMALSKADISEEGDPCILYGELYTKYGPVINYVHSRTNSDQNKRVFGKRNDVLIPSSGETAFDIACASALETEDVLLGGDLNLFRPIERVNGAFLSYQINGVRKFELSKLAQGASVVHLYSNSLKNFKVKLPTFEEQQKIASLLQSLDRKIEKQLEKIEKLEQFKKGMMQKIFSQELRFKDEDGGEFPEWENKKLGEVGLFKSGVGFSEKFQGKQGLKYPFIKVSDMNLEQNAKSIVVSNHTVSNEMLREMKVKAIEDPAILFAKVGAAIFLERKRIIRTPFLIDNNMMSFIPLKNMDLEFAYHLLNYLRLSAFAQVGALPSYNGSDLGTIKIQLPVLKEQLKISRYINSVDLKIEKEKEKLMVLEEQKRGFMWGMFV